VHRFTLRPSAILAAILLVAHTAAVAVLFLLNLPAWTLVAGAAVQDRARALEQAIPAIVLRGRTAVIVGRPVRSTFAVRTGIQRSPAEATTTTPTASCIGSVSRG